VITRKLIAPLVAGILLVASSLAAAQGTPAVPGGDAPGDVVPLAGPGEGLEAAIGGLDYRVGPGDVLAIGVWGPDSQVWEVPVGLEGSVLIPTVGPVGVDGLLLQDAKARIRDEVLASYRDIDITVTLVRLRRFQVHVLGQVSRPGTYLGTAVDRVSAAVGWAGGLLPAAGSRRVLVRNDGEVRATADLELFLARGVDTANPLLRDGDVVYVPYPGLSFNVLGAVNDPGAFEFLPGDRFRDALRLAGGVTREAFLDTVEVARFLEGRREPVRFFALSDGRLVPADPAEADLLPSVESAFRPDTLGMNLPGDAVYGDFLLRPDDMVFIRFIPEERKKRLVEAAGEVRYPGRYAIEEGTTRISDLVAMAGGLTDEAFLAEAQLVRLEAADIQDREYARLTNMQPADMDEDEYAYFKVRSRENPGRMVVDLEALFERGDDSQDLVLRRGDILTIPSRKDFVSVIGNVQDPGNVLFQSGLSGREYVALAGGYAEDADKGKARVIRAAGGEWVPLDEARTVYRGDTVFIPEKGKSKFWSTFKDALLITTQVAAIYVVIDAAVN
jgi:protein involved in polysaccharide export with SLBB domain